MNQLNIGNMAFDTYFPNQEMSVKTAHDVIRAYHEDTKHQLNRYAVGPGSLDWASQPDPFRHWTGTKHFSLPRSASGIDIAWGGLAASRNPAPFNLVSLGNLLQLTCAITAWKQFGSQRWALRANPSAGNLHPIETWVIARGLAGIQDGLYHYQAKDHSVEWRAGTDAASGVPGLWLGFSSIHWREAWKYGERALRYCQLDTGHILAALAYAATLFGWRPRMVDLAPDTLAHCLGLDRDDDFAFAEPEEAQVMVALHVDPGKAAPQPRLDWDEWHGRPSLLDPRPLYRWPVIEEAAKATRGPLPELPSTRPGYPLPNEGGRHATSVILKRRSAQAFDGASVMPAAVFRRMMQSLQSGGSPVWSMWSGAPRVHPILFVHRVEGIAPGLYVFPRSEAGLTGLRQAMQRDFEWTPVDDQLPLYRLVDSWTESTARTVSCHQEIASHCAVSFMFVAEFEAPIEASPAAWRHLHWEAGMLGHCLTLEAEAAGWRGAGIGCFFDDVDHDILGLADTRYQSVYHHAIGMAVDDPRHTTQPAYE